MEQQALRKEQSALEVHKQKLAEYRMLKRPIEKEAIDEHDYNYMLSKQR